EADIRRAAAARKSAEADVERARAAEEAAQHAHKRQQELQNEKIGFKTEVDRAEAQLRAAQAAVRAAQAKVSEAEAAGVAARAKKTEAEAARNMARLGLDMTVVKVPAAREDRDPSPGSPARPFAAVGDGAVVFSPTSAPKRKYVVLE